MNEDPSKSATTLLDDVRVALGRTRTIIPEPLPPFVDSNGETGGTLVERFAAEALSLGATVSRLERVELLAARIADICHSAGVTEVVISGSNLLEQMDLKGQLAPYGVKSRSVAEFKNSTKEELIAHLAECPAGVTAVESAIAETGTIVLTSAEDQALLVSLLPPIHIAVLKASQIKQSLTTVIEDLNRDQIRLPVPLSSATFISGPSRTSDVELTLSIGVHGPKELHLIILELTREDTPAREVVTS